MIAGVTSGVYYNAATAQDLRAVYENLGTNLVIKPVTTEVTAIFAGVGLLVLLLGGLCSALWFGRLP